jgi:presenilin-like A22 family membrane protease
MSKLVAGIVLFFVLSQLLGIYSGVVILSDFYQNPYVSSLVVTTDTESPANALFFMIYIIVGAAIMIFLIRKFGLHLIIFRAMEFVLLSTASSIVFYSFLRIFFGFDTSTMGGIILGLSLASIKVLKPSFKNVAAVLATAGVGVIFGISLTPLPVILFLLLLSAYDYVSVFKTKHMVEMADFIVKKELAFTVTSKEIIRGKERRIDLGTGDLIAPVIFEVSTLSYSPAATVLVFLGALLSLAAFLLIVWKKRIVLPALPPIVFGMLLFFLLGMILGFY